MLVVLSSHFCSLVGIFVGSNCDRFQSFQMDLTENGFVLCVRSVSENAFGDQPHFLIPLAILMMN